MANSTIQLSKIIRPDLIVDLKANTKREALSELGDVIGNSPNVIDPAVFLEEIYKREELASTGVGLGFAIPHVKIAEVKDYVIAVGRKVEGLEFDSLDGNRN